MAYHDCFKQWPTAYIAACLHAIACLASKGCSSMGQDQYPVPNLVVFMCMHLTCKDQC